MPFPPFRRYLLEPNETITKWNRKELLFFGVASLSWDHRQSAESQRPGHQTKNKYQNEINEQNKKATKQQQPAAAAGWEMHKKALMRLLIKLLSDNRHHTLSIGARGWCHCQLKEEVDRRKQHKCVPLHFYCFSTPAAGCWNAGNEGNRGPASMAFRHDT